MNLYGLMIVAGIVGIIGLVKLAVERRGLSSELIWEFLPWVMVGGVVGARLYHVIDLWQYYRLQPMEIFFVWHGGLGIYGGILGGVAAAYLGYRYSIRRRMPELKKKLEIQVGEGMGRQFVSLLDSAALGIPLGQAIGRWGNYFNQELYGPPTDLPWGIWITPTRRLPGYESFDRFHPLFAYEAVWNLLALGVLWLVELKTNNNSVMRRPGMMFGLYLSLYAVGRMGLETLRLQSWQILGVATTWWVGGAILVGYGGLGWYYLGRGRGRVRKRV